MKNRSSRLEQLGCLMTAMIAIIVGGDSGLIPKKPRRRVLHSSKRAYYGLFSEVARELGTWPSHVRRVFLGQSTSERVMKAILAAIERHDREKKGGRAA